MNVHAEQSIDSSIPMSPQSVQRVATAVEKTSKSPPLPSKLDTGIAPRACCRQQAVQFPAEMTSQVCVGQRLESPTVAQQVCKVVGSRVETFAGRRGG